MTEEQKNKIDAMSYEQLLSQWRYAPIGDPMFKGECGTYYKDVMDKKKQEIGDGAAVNISKKISC